jgi:hypothetical protein
MPPYSHENAPSAGWGGQSGGLPLNWETGSHMNGWSAAREITNVFNFEQPYSDSFIAIARPFSKAARTKLKFPKGH